MLCFDFRAEVSGTFFDVEPRPARSGSDDLSIFVSLSFVVLISEDDGVFEGFKFGESGLDVDVRRSPP